MSEGSELIVNAEEAEYFHRKGWRADKWALSSESTLALEIFAYLASSGAKTYAQVVDDVEASQFGGYDPLYLARLFRIVAVRPSSSISTNLHSRRWIMLCQRCPDFRDGTAEDPLLRAPLLERTV